MAASSQHKRGRTGLVIAGLGFGLAAGVAAGTLVVAPNLPGSDGSAVSAASNESEAAQREADISAAQADAADNVLAGASGELVTGALEDRPIMVFRTADADPEDVDAITRLIGEAGGNVSGEVTLTDHFLAQDGADSLKSIVTNTLPAGAQLSEDRLDPGTHAGEALGYAFLLNPDNGEGQGSDEDRALLMGALRDQGFIDYRDGSVLPGQVAVVITGDSDGSGEAGYGASVLAHFAGALQSRGNGAVLGGRIHSASDTGAVGIVRRDADLSHRVSTVDSLSREWARVATVLAIPEQLGGRAGAYGATADAVAGLPDRAPGDEHRDE